MGLDDIDASRRCRCSGAQDECRERRMQDAETVSRDATEFVCAHRPQANAFVGKTRMLRLNIQDEAQRLMRSAGDEAMVYWSRVQCVRAM